MLLAVPEAEEMALCFVRNWRGKLIIFDMADNFCSGLGHGEGVWSFSHILGFQSG